MMVAIVAELLLESKSVSLELALAEFGKTPCAVGVTTIVVTAEASAFTVPRAQVIVVVPLQIPWVDVAETKLTPGGSTSVRFTFVAGAGPLLLTVIR